MKTEKMQKLKKKFFSSAVKNLKIPEHQEGDSLPIFKAIMKFRNHPRITVIKNLYSGSRCNFCKVSVEGVAKKN